MRLIYLIIFFSFLETNFYSQKVQAKNTILEISYQDPQKGKILAIRDSKQALEANDIDRYLLDLGTICYCYYMQRDPNSLIVIANQLITDSKKYKKLRNELDGYSYISDAYLQLNLYLQAEQSIDKALIRADKLEGDEAIKIKAQLYTSLAEIFNQKEDDRKSLYYHKIALESYKNLKNDEVKNQGILVSYFNISQNYFYLNKIDSSIYFSDKALSLNPKKYGLYGPLSSIYLNFGQCYFKKKEYEKAIQNLNKAVVISDSVKAYKIKLDAYEDLALVYKTLHKYDQYIKYDSLHKKLNDSLNNIKTKALEKAVDSITDEKVREEKTKQYIYFLIIFLVVGLLILFLFFKNKKQKKDKLRIENLLKKENNKVKELKSRINSTFDEVVNLAKQNDPTFLTRFSEVYPEIILKLNTDYPDLSLNQLKLLAYCYLNFSTKDIATYTHVTIRSVQTSKYRIRKLIDIESDADLNDWIKNL